MANNFRIAAGGGRFLTLLAQDGPVTAQADNPGALNQIWNIPGFAGNNSPIQNLGYQAPGPFANPIAGAVVGDIPPTAWNFIVAGGNNFIQQVGANLTWTVGPGPGGAVALLPANFADPTQQLGILPA
ncbi:hypothetical protein PAXINDRAFT_17529 [Paxillus involutus ATCC 200175]|uniref:Uncharacterized protein n=1 Tax=Paxillus involutus ATCC 200175 TaxID=664439 RepID=A0A0C9TNF6_PAXIN|nr:hypothetical protein PAXINDRAFT_17529 [Paxillus involutus ATCC 200175]